MTSISSFARFTSLVTIAGTNLTISIWRSGFTTRYVKQEMENPNLQETSDFLTDPLSTTAVIVQSLLAPASNLFAQEQIKALKGTAFEEPARFLQRITQISSTVVTPLELGIELGFDRNLLLSKLLNANSLRLLLKNGCRMFLGNLGNLATWKATLGEPQITSSLMGVAEKSAKLAAAFIAFVSRTGKIV